MDEITHKIYFLLLLLFFYFMFFGSLKNQTKKKEYFKIQIQYFPLSVK